MACFLDLQKVAVLLQILGTTAILGLGLMVLLGTKYFPPDSKIATLYMRTMRLMAVFILLVACVRFCIEPCRVLSHLQGRVINGIVGFGAFLHILILWFRAEKE